MTYADLGSEEYPQKFYMEYVPCTYGENWSVENFNSDMLPEWQDLLVETNSTLVEAFGIGYEEKSLKERKKMPIGNFYGIRKKMLKLVGKLGKAMTKPPTGQKPMLTFLLADQKPILFPSTLT